MLVAMRTLSRATTTREVSAVTMNAFIKEDMIGKYIVFKGDDEAEEENLYLEDKPIAFQQAIICRGTTCYRAKRQHSKNWEFVAKFSWRSDKRGGRGTLEVG